MVNSSSPLSNCPIVFLWEELVELYRIPVLCQPEAAPL